MSAPVIHYSKPTGVAPASEREEEAEGKEVASSASLPSPHGRLWSRMHGLTRHTHAHAVQIGCRACSMRWIDQIRPETVVCGP